MKEDKPKENKPTRKGSTPIVVRVNPDEKAAIEEFARLCGRSTSGFLRMLGLGYLPKSIVDNERVEELAKINGDLGRLGGLLKLWLTNDARTAQFGEITIRAALARIEDTQDKMVEVMKAVVLPRSVK
ncbi:conjugal transfer transcriptional regulator TraJ [Methylomonas sp. AM2-LC]|uniref:conjugal transfer transcriptional regulator TraJ n=1 Tax=Methylomonas sp. AM2-LC TaxID=3153301 RepID=UPI0032678268